METTTVTIKKPDAVSLILGQAHFIKTVEDIHEAMVGSAPGISFAVAFCEASGDRLVRVSGTDDSLVALAASNALAIGAGHSFVVVLGEGFYPINVLNTLKMVPEVCRIFCATSNAVEVIVGVTEMGRAILGVVDGEPPVGMENKDGIKWRHDLLRTLGYKL